MLAVVQCVGSASVTTEADDYRAVIGPGLCVLLCAEHGDGPAESEWMAGKIARLRIFRDEHGRLNRSVREVGGEVLLISQFTLAADCSKGNRPSFVGAADPDLGRALYEEVGQLIEGTHRVPVKWGVFGAMMQISLVNDGPVTVIVRTK